jgi:3D (Asp-Asp-Asp) domain-containing protein
MIIEAILIGTLTATSYRAVPEQTKSECRGNHACQTSIGENVSELGVAISQDLLANGKVHYHDCVYISGIGFRIINDTMHPRIHNSIDVFVYEKAEEKAFGVQHLKVYLIRIKQKSPGGNNELQKLR